MFEGSLERQKRKPSRKFSRQKDLNFQGKKQIGIPRKKSNKLMMLIYTFQGDYGIFLKGKTYTEKLKPFFIFSDLKKKTTMNFQ